MKVFSKHLLTVLAVTALSLSASSAAYAHDRGNGHGWWNFISSWFHPYGFNQGKHEGHDRGHGHHKGLHKVRNPWDSHDSDPGADTFGGHSHGKNKCSGTTFSVTVVDEGGSNNLPADSSGNLPIMTYCSSDTVGSAITGAKYTTKDTVMQLCKNTYIPGTTIRTGTDCQGTQTADPLDPTATLEAAGVLDDARG
ncbi:MAG: hypothetical protein P8126_05360 [Gammaproteobacteria bacterium]